MAEGQEKTEPATPRRRHDARQKGQVARSPELSGAVALIAMILTLRAGLGNAGLLEYLQFSLSTLHEHAHSPAAASEAAAASREALRHLFRALGLSLGVGCAAGVAASVAQVGFLWTSHPIIPDVSRINPATGLGRLLGLRGALEAAKAVLKLAVVGAVVYSTVRADLLRLIALITVPTERFLPELGGTLYTLCLRVAVVFLVIAVLDYAYQRWDFEKSLRMSKEEIRQEHKQTEGDPMIKQAIRQRQRDVARRRMMQDVPKADVIITNPTHFAVALAYDADAMRAPKVLAKGQDLVAARIRALAQEHDVPLVENPPLARALHKEVEIGQEVPPALYAAVAEVLAYIYDRDRARAPRRNTL